MTNVCVARIHSNPGQKHCAKPATKQLNGAWFCDEHYTQNARPAPEDKPQEKAQPLHD